MKLRVLTFAAAAITLLGMAMTFAGSASAAAGWCPRC
jgi:hypothetical protein